MTDQSGPSAEAREVALNLCVCTCGKVARNLPHHGSCDIERSARALDDFAQKWREEAEMLESKVANIHRRAQKAEGQLTQSITIPRGTPFRYSAIENGKVAWAVTCWAMDADMKAYGENGDTWEGLSLLHTPTASGTAKRVLELTSSAVAERDALRARVETLQAAHMPHMCRVEHQEIRHADSEHPLCPLCRERNVSHELREEVEKLASQVSYYANSRNDTRKDAIALRARVEGQEKELTDLRRHVEHCNCEALQEHVSEHLPEYMHEDSAHGEPELFNDVERIQYAGDELRQLRARVAELEALCAKPDPHTRLKDAANAIMQNIQACNEEHDAEGYCPCARTILSWLRHYELRGTRWNELHDQQKARAERAEKALREIRELAMNPEIVTCWRDYLDIARNALAEGGGE